MPKRITNFTYKIENQAVESNFVFNIAKKYYDDVVDKEIVLAGITEDDHILCIGGGICPFSAILFHQKTGARVTVLDNNPICIPKAEEVLKRLEIDANVEVIHKDGGDDDICFAKYTVVHFALQVCPMNHVFSQVEKKAATGARLLVRLPKKCLEDMYSCLARPTSTLPHIAHKNARNIGSTMLYIKRA